MFLFLEDEDNVLDKETGSSYLDGGGRGRGCFCDESFSRGLYLEIRFYKI
jgi:hypothetical protein